MDWLHGADSSQTLRGSLCLPGKALHKAFHRIGSEHRFSNRVDEEFFLHFCRAAGLESETTPELQYVLRMCINIYIRNLRLFFG